MTTVGELLTSEELRLRFHGQDAHLDRAIDRVLTTELNDPTELLSGRELVLTAGRRLRGRSAQASFVNQVAKSRATAIGFAVGTNLECVPETMLEAALDHDLPVLEIPSQTSFHSIITQVGAPLQSHLERLLHAQGAMFDSLLSQGITGVLSRLTEATGEPSAVIRLPDQVLASVPAGHQWALDLDHLNSDEVRVVPVELPGLRYALLANGGSDLAIDLENHAAGLIKLELAKQQAVRAGRRGLTGQVIEDVVRSAITTREATRRLRAAGIDPADAHSVLVFAEGTLTADLGVATAIATVGRYEAVVLHGEQPALEVARMLAEHNPDITSIGVGGPYQGVHGLRWAFIEAQEAAGRGPGVHEGRVIDMPTLLMSNPDLPVREVASKVLQPLTAFDAERGGELVRTLEAFLGSGGSPQLTAKELFVHRNTVRYRLEQIERLTGLSLSSVEARVHLWLAMRAISQFGDAD